METRIFLIRHGESKQNIANVISGVTDTPLSTKGKTQCKQLSGYFDKMKMDVVYASPLQRSQESAQLIFPQHATTLQISESLIEFDYGQYEGYERDKYASINDEVIKKWVTAPGDLTFPGGGNVREHAQDSYTGLLNIVEENQGKVIACVSHRTTIRLIVAKVLGLSLDNFRLLPCSNCGITELLSVDGEIKLLSLNVELKYSIS
jgi:probable phosphoglycerate mutase